MSSGEVGSALTKDAQTMKEILDSQPKVSFLIPLSPGEADGAYDTVCINGYVLQIKKGAMVQLPTSVVDILANKYKIEMEAGREMRIDRDEATERALS